MLGVAKAIEERSEDIDILAPILPYGGLFGLLRTTPVEQIVRDVVQEIDKVLANRGYVHDVVISCGAEVIARHPRSYEREDFVFDPLHYLALIEQKINALDQAAPLAVAVAGRVHDVAASSGSPDG